MIDECVLSIDNIGENPDFDANLYRFVNLAHLNLKSNLDCMVQDKDIQKLRNLKSLELGEYSMIGDEGIRDLVNLTFLDIQFHPNISNFGIENLVNLTSLNIEGTTKISDNAIRKLINLSSLYANDCISNDVLRDLNHLKL